MSPPNHTYAAVVVIIDGCTVKCLAKAKTPFIDGLIERGSYSLSCKSIYPTVTYAAHSSILTGVKPHAHGIVGNTFYDRELDKIIDLDEYDVNSLLLSRTLFEMVEGVKAAVGEPVTKGADIVVTKEEVQSSGVWKQDEYAIEKAIDIIVKQRPTFLAINLPGMDAISERFGPESREAIRAMEKVDELIGRLDDALRNNYADHLLVILSDHGLTEVRENLDLKALLKDLGPTEFLIFPSHRFAHIYISSKEKREEAKRILRSDPRLELVLDARESEEFGLSSPRTGDLLVFAARGYELGPQKLKGSHGGITLEEMLVPLIVNKREYADQTREARITDLPKIVLRYLREKEVERIVREKLKDVDPSHGWEHVERVLGLATKLAVKYGADVEAVRLSALLHDSERGETPDIHVKRSEKFARDLLNRTDISTPKMEVVLRAIRNHHTDKPESLETLEEKILWDADKLDALGLIGLARCLQGAGYKRKGLEHALDHLRRDVEMLSDTMHFQDTKAMAQEKLRNVKKFIELLNNEIELTEKS